jgi:hypothetical protein
LMNFGTYYLILVIHSFISSSAYGGLWGGGRVMLMWAIRNYIYLSKRCGCMT